LNRLQNCLLGFHGTPLCLASALFCLGDPILDLLQLPLALCFLLLQFGEPLCLSLTVLGRLDALLDFIEALLRLCHRALLGLPLSLQPPFGGLKVRSGRRRWWR
jgi:hypothetical protein